jgi:hypothetical protein
MNHLRYKITEFLFGSSIYCAGGGALTGLLIAPVIIYKKWEESPPVIHQNKIITIPLFILGGSVCTGACGFVGGIAEGLVPFVTPPACIGIGTYKVYQYTKSKEVKN